MALLVSPASDGLARSFGGRLFGMESDGSAQSWEGLCRIRERGLFDAAEIGSFVGLQGPSRKQDVNGLRQ